VGVDVDCCTLYIGFALEQPALYDAPAGPGFKRFVIKPEVVGDLT